MSATPRLIVMRHAKSSWRHPGLDDHARPLNGRGKRSADVMAVELERLGWCPDRVISSDATRTRETWERMSQVLPDVTATFHRSLYLAGLMQASLEVMDAQCPPCTILLLGHNPGWSHLVSELTGIPTALKTADAALLEPQSFHTWDDLMTQPRAWKLAQMIRSRNVLEADLGTT